MDRRGIEEVQKRCHLWFSLISCFLILLDLRSVAKLFPESMDTSLSKVQRLFYSILLKSLSLQQLSNIVVGSVGTLITVEFVLLSQWKNCVVVLNHSQKADP